MTDKDDHDALVRLIADVAALDRLITQHQVLSQRADDLLALEFREKLSTVNEFRGALSDAQRTMLTKAEFEAVLLGLHRQQDDVHAELAAIGRRLSDVLLRADYEPRHTQLEDRISQLSQRLEHVVSEQQGQAAGVAQATRIADRNRTLTFAILGLILTVLGVFTVSLRGIDSVVAKESKETPTTVVVTPTTKAP